MDNLNKLKLEQVSALTSLDFRGFPVDAIFFLKFANEQIKQNLKLLSKLKIDGNLSVTFQIETSNLFVFFFLNEFFFLTCPVTSVKTLNNQQMSRRRFWMYKVEPNV